MIRFELSYLPPTTNELYNPLVVGKFARLVKSSEGRNFALRCVNDVRELGAVPLMPLEGPLLLACTFWVPTIASDVSNRLKALEDALTEVGMWHDDKQVAEVRLIKLVGEPRTRCIIERAEDAQPLLVERLAESSRQRGRKLAKKAQTHLGFDWRDDGPPRCVAVPNVRRSR